MQRGSSQLKTQGMPLRKESLQNSGLPVFKHVTETYEILLNLFSVIQS